jgi:hypothetical protein
LLMAYDFEDEHAELSFSIIVYLAYSLLVWAPDNTIDLA